MTAHYTINEEKNGIEISFDSMPSKDTRDQMKANGFRWHNVKRVWYARKNEKTLALAFAICNNSTKCSTDRAEKTEKRTTQNHVKIYWNGIKIGGGKLIKCGYSLDNNASGEKSVSIYARDYCDLPRDLLPVKNDSDSYTDYFDNDHAYITEDHPLYKYFRFCAEKAKNRECLQSVEYHSKQLERKPEPWEGYYNFHKDAIKTAENFVAYFKTASNPGQPLQEDLDMIDARRTEAENRRKQKEHEAELKRREKMLNNRTMGKRLVDSEAKKNPIKDGEPVIVINWSEHPAFYDYADDELVLSVSAAEIILKTLDEQEHQDTESGYFKTKFTVKWTDENGEESTYIGRYDLGDGDGGLIKHIRLFGEWQLNHTEFGAMKETPEETNDIIEFACWLSGFVA